MSNPGSEDPAVEGRLSYTMFPDGILLDSKVGIRLDPARGLGVENFRLRGAFNVGWGAQHIWRVKTGLGIFYIVKTLKGENMYDYLTEYDMKAADIADSKFKMIDYKIIQNIPEFEDESIFLLNDIGRKAREREIRGKRQEDQYRESTGESPPPDYTGSVGNNPVKLQEEVSAERNRLLTKMYEAAAEERVAAAEKANPPLAISRAAPGSRMRLNALENSNYAERFGSLGSNTRVKSAEAKELERLGVRNPAVTENSLATSVAKNLGKQRAEEFNAKFFFNEKPWYKSFSFWGGKKTRKGKGKASRKAKGSRKAKASRRR